MGPYHLPLVPILDYQYFLFQIMFYRLSNDLNNNNNKWEYLNLFLQGPIISFINKSSKLPPPIYPNCPVSCYSEHGIVLLLALFMWASMPFLCLKPLDDSPLSSEWNRSTWVWSTGLVITWPEPPGQLGPSFWPPLTWCFSDSELWVGAKAARVTSLLYFCCFLCTEWHFSSLFYMFHPSLSSCIIFCRMLSLVLLPLGPLNWIRHLCAPLTLCAYSYLHTYLVFSSGSELAKKYLCVFLVKLHAFWR